MLSGFVVVALAIAGVTVAVSNNDPSTKQLLTGSAGAKLVRKAAASEQSADMLATRWNARTILASAEDGDTPVQALRRFFAGIEPNDLLVNPALAAAASADFFATVFPDNDGRPPQLDLSIAAEDAWRTPIPPTTLLEKYDGEWWTNAFTFAFSDTLEAHRTSGVAAQPIVAVLSGPREPGGLAVTWSPDGSAIAVRSKLAVTIFDAVNLAESQRWALQKEGLEDPPLSMAWSPDSTRVAYTDNLSGAMVRSVGTGEVVATFLGERPSVESTTTPRIYMVRSLAWAADGQRIVSAGDGDGVIVWNAATGAPLAVYRGESAADAQWLTADRVLVKARFTERRSTWDIGRKAWTSTLPGFAFDEMAVSPDGQFVATSRPYFVVIRKLR